MHTVYTYLQKNRLGVTLCSTEFLYKIFLFMEKFTFKKGF